MYDVHRTMFYIVHRTMYNVECTMHYIYVHTRTHARTHAHIVGLLDYVYISVYIVHRTSYDVLCTMYYTMYIVHTMDRRV